MLILLLACPAPVRQLGRILFIGNSITQTKPNMAELGWDGNWGAAASQADLDYVHRIQLEIAARQGSIPEIRIIQTSGDLYPPGTIETIRDWQPELIILQIGDNAPQDRGEWLGQYVALRRAAPHTRIIAVGVWAIDDPRDDYIQEAAYNAGISYVKISDLHTPETEAWSQCLTEFCHAGLYWHPGNEGMGQIAQRILSIIYTAQGAYLPLVRSTLSGTIPE